MEPVSHQTVRLAEGKHQVGEREACVMELASMLAGDPFTDHPRSVCPVVAAYMRWLNDTVDDEQRHELYRYAAAAVGTRGDDDARRRRLELCRLELEALEAERTRWRRLVAPRAPETPERSLYALDRYAMHLVREIMRGSGDWHRRAMAFADELIAAGEPARAERRLAGPEKQQVATS
jgi:hypothetical protein